MVFGFVYKFIAGAILSSFLIYPAIEDPKVFAEATFSWITNATPVFKELLGLIF